MKQNKSDYFNWQFLRRNLNYQKDYDQGNIDPYTWGLREFCDYKITDLPENLEIIPNSIEVFGTHTKDDLLGEAKIFKNCSFFSIKNFFHQLTRKKRYLVLVVDLEAYKTARGNPDSIILSQIKKQINEEGNHVSPTKINNELIQAPTDPYHVERMIKVYDEMESGKSAYKIIKDHIEWYYKERKGTEYSIESFTSLPKNDHKQTEKFIRLAPFIRFNFK